MSREEFMKQLENLLSDVSEEEKKEALEYYRGYFEDAGEENEERILRELESPERVALTIKADLEMGKDKENESGIYTERGYQEERFTYKQELDNPDSAAQEDSAQKDFTQSDSAQNNFTQREAEQEGFAQRDAADRTSNEAQDNSAKAWKILLIVVAAVITSPIWIGITGGLFGGVMGLAGGLFGVLIAAIAVAGGMYIAGAVIVGVGISQLVVGSAAAGVAMLGVGFLMLALAVLATIVCVWLYGRFLPWLIRGIVALCKKVFSGKGRVE